MKLAFKEIMDMITNGTLHYNQSTQRKFVYASIDAQLSCGKTTKAGSLINAVLEEDIQLPAVYFWHNTDTGHLNIHDGKQRLLSFYYFISPTASINITTIRNGKPTMFAALSQDDQDKLLNYTFDIVERTGNSTEEERSFYLINTNSVNLTSYECLSGMLYGTFLHEFEIYIDHLTLDKVKPVGRGEQAFKFLLTIFNLCDSNKALSNDKSMLLLSDAVRPLRQNIFEAKDFRFNEIITVFNDLMRACDGIKEDRALTVANFIVRNKYRADDIIEYYRRCARLINDITDWDIATHKTFIKAYIEDGLKLDPQRNFTKEVKDIIYTKSPRCAYVDNIGNRCTETSYSKLEVDHIVPWSKGGLTTLDNAQLLCKHHNTSKGNDED